MAQFLVNILTECGQEVPDFLSQYKVEDAGAIDFNDDSGVEENDELADKETNGDAW